MRVIRGWVFVLMVFCAVFTAAQTMTVEQAIADLKNPDVAVRTRAAAFLY